MRIPVILVLLSAPLAAEEGARGRVVDPALQRQIDEAVPRGMDYLRRMQRGDGRWTYGRSAALRLVPGRAPRLERNAENQDRPHVRDGALTALAVYAMAANGAPRDDGNVARALSWIGAHATAFDHTSDFGTEATSLLILAYARLDAAHFGPEIRVLADRLAAAQDPSGLFGRKLRAPRRGGTRPDHATTQMAVLALWAAESLAGWKAPEDVWRRVEAHFRKVQQRDGSWGIRPGEATPDPDASMIAAGLSCFVYASVAQDAGERALHRARTDPVARRGLAAFRRALRSPDWSDSFAAFSIERVATVLGLPDRLWYTGGARILALRQDEKGYWKGTSENSDSRFVYDTSLVLLFLGRGTLPPRRGVVLTPRAAETFTVRERLPLLRRAESHRRAFDLYVSLPPDARRAEWRTVGARGAGFVDFLVLALEIDGREEARAAAHALLEHLLGKRLLYRADADAPERAMMAVAIRTTWERLREGSVYDENEGRYVPRPGGG